MSSVFLHYLIASIAGILQALLEAYPEPNRKSSMEWLEPSQTSTITILIVNYFYKTTIIYIWQGSKYASDASVLC